MKKYREKTFEAVRILRESAHKIGSMGVLLPVARRSVGGIIASSDFDVDVYVEQQRILAGIIEENKARVAQGFPSIKF